MNFKFDPSLYFVTKQYAQNKKNYFNIIQKAVEGGVTMVQLREKHLLSHELLNLATKLKILLDKNNVPLIINDHIEIAKAVGASGVHLGQKDISVQKAREFLGPGFIIGLSIENADQLLCFSEWTRQKASERTYVDYIAASPVFSTLSKQDAALPLGLHGLKALKQNTTLPLVGIGGIHLQNAASVIQSGADGVAVISAIWDAHSPLDAANQLSKLIRQTKAYKFKESNKNDK